MNTRPERPKLTASNIKLRSAPAATDLAEAWPRGATPRLRSGVAAETSNPRSRSGGCTGTGGLRGATPRSRSGGVVVMSYPSSKVRSAASLCWSSREEILHVQGKRNPSKMVGVASGHQRADTPKP